MEPSSSGLFDSPGKAKGKGKGKGWASEPS